MDRMPTEEVEARFAELIQDPPYPVAEMIGLIGMVPNQKGEELALALLKALSDAQDFNGAYALLEACYSLFDKKLHGVAIRDALRKSTVDRLLISFVDGVGFGVRSLKEAVGRLGRLLSFRPKALVLSAAWGLGEVRSLDYFYRRITVDFRLRRGHQFTFDAACETLIPAPENHILVLQKVDPTRVETMLKDKPGDFVKEMLASFGDMPVTRLEELCSQHGFVKPMNWKKFWDAARKALHEDKSIEIPTRRAEPIHIKAVVEDYGTNWFGVFEQMRDPKCILSSVREFLETHKLSDDNGEDPQKNEEKKQKIADRLAFALKGSKGVDDALFARIAICIADLQLDPYMVDKLEHARTEKARAYLWAKGLHDEERYLAAARTLPARDIGSLVRFMTAVDTENTKHQLLAVMPQMCFSLISETISYFKKDPECEEVVSDLLRHPNPPATLVTLILGHYSSFKEWEKLPSLVMILTHAIALGEGKQGGETLRMQNMIRRLFADTKWLEKILNDLAPADKALFFERFQASIAWEASTHHLIVIRMTKIAPELNERLIRKVEVKKIEHITSLRSYAERQAAYEHLVSVEMPQNRKDIEEAREKGDLSENAEYQYAKDKERELIKKQSDMQLALSSIKAVDFADVLAPTEVVPGSMVEIVTSTGATINYTVLGEWDNDLERGIISNQTKLAQNMLGKKVGDTFELPDEEGNVSVATIKAVSALDDAMRAWIKDGVKAS